MNPGQPQIEDYSKVDSRTLLNEGTKAHEALNLAWAVLMLRASLLVKEVTANGASERAKQIEAEARETLGEYQMLRKEATAVEAEVVRRIWRNNTNGNFAKFKIGLLRSDYRLQDEALLSLRKILGSIPWTKDKWFHPEGPDGMNSLTNLLLTKELRRHEHLDLPTTLEYAMNNKFAYLYVAAKRDFLDEIDKYRRRPFERYRELDEPDDGDGQAEDLGKNPIIENLDRETRIIRLREAANEETNVIDQGIIRHAADLLTDEDVSRAGLISQVSEDLGVTPQYVRRRLGTGRLLAKIKQALLPEAGRQGLLPGGDKEK